MALSWDDITGITKKHFEPVMYDNIYGSNPALARYKSKMRKVSGGTKILVPVLYATNAYAQRLGTASTLNTSTNAKKTAAEYEWKRYAAPIVVDGLDELKNAGDAAVISHVKTEVESAEKSMADIMGTDIHAVGSTTGSLQGHLLGTAASGTCGGIAKGTYSWWQGQVDSTTTSLTLASMQALFGDCTVDNDRPTVIYTTQDVYDDAYALIQPQQRFGDENTIKAGFTNILWNGVPIIVDSHVATGDVHMINEKYTQLTVHKDRDFIITPFQKPTNEDASKAHAMWAGALCWKNCRMCGSMTAIA